MNRISTRSVATLAVALVALAMVAVVAANLGRAATPDPTPSSPPVATPAPSPSVTPTPILTPSPIATPSPQPSGPTGGRFEFDLDVSTPHRISVVVLDEVGNVTGASSGQAGDGMSVAYGEVLVKNVDADTIEVTWIGGAADAEVNVRVTGTPDKPILLIAQPDPDKDGDAFWPDRVMVLDFSTAVDAADVTGHVQEGFDTAD